MADIAQNEWPTAYQEIVRDTLKKQNQAESLRSENEELRKFLQQQQDAQWQTDRQYSRSILEASRDREIAHFKRMADVLERIEKVLNRWEAK